MERLDEVLQINPRVPAAIDEPEPTVDDGSAMVDGEIEIRGLTYAYGDGARREPVLQDVRLTIPRGSRVALVGPVGSGKSTLVALLARVYPVPAGRIFIGGRDINEIPVSRLRRSIGYAPQEPFLFSRSIRENITVGSPAATAASIDAAVETARLGGDLRALPRGLDTVVGERGVTLSGGQRQRATLARAIVGDPRILILDDSLSSVDADTEQAILDGLDRVMRGRTSILISHRHATLARADRIVVLDGGRMVEQGTHEELLARRGLYERLFQRHRLTATLEGR
jgi:ATP-binding cassette subfamily B protein